MNRTFGETKNCKGCRYWSEMITKCEGGGQVQAYCLTPNKSAPYALKYTFGLQSCSEWASGEDGAVDEPGSDPLRYESIDARKEAA